VFLWLLFLSAWAATAQGVREIIVTNDLEFEKDAVLSARLVIRTDNITIRANGATLKGEGKTGDSTSLEKAGIGVRVENATNVTIRDLRVHGFSTGLSMKQVRGAWVTNCDFSDNYANPKFGWGEMPARGGILFLSLDSWGWEPFNVWLDGLTVE
jgi:pectate lyase